MVTHHIKKWLADHPNVLSGLFWIVLLAAEKGPDVTGKSGASSFMGP